MYCHSTYCYSESLINYSTAISVTLLTNILINNDGNQLIEYKRSSVFLEIVTATLNNNKTTVLSKK